MNPAVYFILLLPIIILLIQQKKNKDCVMQHMKHKQGKEGRVMREAAEKFLNKECLIYLLSGEVSGTIREVTDHALLVETPTDRQAINLEFVMRIREYPRNKNGKKKSIILD